MAKQRNVIIVGAGLFGSMAATAARERGHNVTIVDSGETYAASKASGCVLAPSWMSFLPKERITAGMDFLDEHYAVLNVSFTTGLGRPFNAKRVNPADILRKPDDTRKVLSVGNGEVTLTDRTKLKGVVLVAAGMGCAALLPGKMPPMQGWWGASVWIKGEHLAEPQLRVYQPYRQVVAFNMDAKTIWAGDGTRLVESTWAKDGPARAEATRARVQKTLGLSMLKGVTVTTGARPFVVGHKDGYFRQLDTKLFVSTGGAKSGTILAAIQAQEFIKGAGL